MFQWYYEGIPLLCSLFKSDLCFFSFCLTEGFHPLLPIVSFSLSLPSATVCVVSCEVPVTLDTSAGVNVLAEGPCTQSWIPTFRAKGRISFSKCLDGKYVTRMENDPGENRWDVFKPATGVCVIYFFSHTRCESRYGVRSPGQQRYYLSGERSPGAVHLRSDAKSPLIRFTVCYVSLSPSHGDTEMTDLYTAKSVLTKGGRPNTHAHTRYYFWWVNVVEVLTI